MWTRPVVCVVVGGRGLSLVFFEATRGGLAPPTVATTPGVATVALVDLEPSEPAECRPLQAVDKRTSAVSTVGTVSRLYREGFIEDLGFGSGPPTCESRWYSVLLPGADLFRSLPAKRLRFCAVRQHGHCRVTTVDRDHAPTWVRRGAAEIDTVDGRARSESFGPQLFG